MAESELPNVLMLAPQADFEVVNTKINQITIDKMGLELQQYLDMSFQQFEAAGNSFNYFMQPLEEVHLKSDNYGGFEPEGDIIYVYIFTAIVAFILVIACINFMNLSTARSANGAKEVGLRKVLGVSLGQLLYLMSREISVLIAISFVIVSALGYWGG